MVETIHRDKNNTHEYTHKDNSTKKQLINDEEHLINDKSWHWDGVEFCLSSFTFVFCSGVVANLELGERSGVWGRAPSGVQGQSPWSGGQEGEAPLKLRAFLFLDIPREGPFFTSPQNFVNFVNHTDTYFK